MKLNQGETRRVQTMTAEATESFQANAQPSASRQALITFFYKTPSAT